MQVNQADRPSSSRLLASLWTGWPFPSCVCLVAGGALAALTAGAAAAAVTLGGGACMRAWNETAQQQNQ